MKRVALDAGAFHRRVQELQIEERVVADEDRAVAALLLDLLADLLEQTAQRFGLVDRGAQRVKRIDARDLQRRRVETRSGKRLHEIAVPLGELEVAVRVEANQDRRDLEQRVGRRVEAAGLDVDDHGEKAAKPSRDSRDRPLLGRAARGRRPAQVGSLALMWTAVA